MKKTIQTWAILGLIVVMMLVMWLSGGNKPAAPPQASPTPSAPPKPADSASTDDFMRRLRDGEQQQNLTTSPTDRTNAGSGMTSGTGVYNTESSGGVPSAPPPDPVAEDLKKRNYTSLYSSSVALSYRQPENHPTNTGPSQPAPGQLAMAEGLQIIPSAPIGATAGLDPMAAMIAGLPPVPPGPPQAQPRPTPRALPANANQSTGKNYTVFEGALLEGVLVNRLDGDFTGPVVVMLSSDLYSHDRQHLLIPAGSKLLGESKQVDSFGQRRLAVFFHRLIMPDGYSVDLDHFQGLNQIGETGLKDKVNNHYLQIFGASVAVGAIGGLAQLGTSSGAIGVPQSSTDVYRQGVTSNVSQSSLHILDRFLNVLPTITVREGHRVKVYLTQDILVPDYTQHTMPANL